MPSDDEPSAAIATASSGLAATMAAAVAEATAAGEPPLLLTTPPQPPPRVIKVAGFGVKNGAAHYIPPEIEGQPAPVWLKLKSNISVQDAYQHGAAGYKDLLEEDNASVATPLTESQRTYYGDYGTGYHIDLPPVSDAQLVKLKLVRAPSGKAAAWAHNREIGDAHPLFQKSISSGGQAFTPTHVCIEWCDLDQPDCHLCTSAASPYNALAAPDGGVGGEDPRKHRCGKLFETTKKKKTGKTTYITAQANRHHAACHNPDGQKKKAMFKPKGS